MFIIRSQCPKILKPLQEHFSRNFGKAPILTWGSNTVLRVSTFFRCYDQHTPSSCHGKTFALSLYFPLIHNALTLSKNGGTRLISASLHLQKILLHGQYHSLCVTCTTTLKMFKKSAVNATRGAKSMPASNKLSALKKAASYASYKLFPDWLKGAVFPSITCHNYSV